MSSWGDRSVTLFIEQLTSFCQGYCKRASFSFKDEAAI